MRKPFRAKRDSGKNTAGVDIVLDSGALIALERGLPSIFDLLEEAVRRGRTIFVPSGVLSQTWRDGRVQARTARILKQPCVRVVAVGERDAKEIGEFIATTAPNSRDVVDAHVALITRARDAVVFTSDSDDIIAYGVDPARVQLV